MPDDKSKRDFRDRDRVSGDEEYEVGYLASKFQLTIPEVRELIKKHGNDRETLEREAKAPGSSYRAKDPPCWPCTTGYMCGYILGIDRLYQPETGAKVPKARSAAVRGLFHLARSGRVSVCILLAWRGLLGAASLLTRSAVLGGVRVRSTRGGRIRALVGRSARHGLGCRRG
ncbi:DUF3606 domain-containing protein [Mesorhizobium sp.]|uniref:DUF3606 domain-containing protein n=1 Tax=Mesorhizobium sp. TaxID=1871066 RepID=UPI00345C2814